MDREDDDFEDGRFYNQRLNKTQRSTGNVILVPTLH